MADFYDGWLKYWDEEQEERKNARTCINEEDYEWVRTKQDYRAALVCAREIGFVTSGVTMVAEIPGRWHTGKHSHGEEAIYILQGRGFSVVDELRYDWETGSCLFMPFGATHQHFNSGEDTVRYLSVMALPLERFAGLSKVRHYEDAGETPLGETEKIRQAESDIHPEYGRIVLRLKDAPVVSAKEQGEFRAKAGGEFFNSMAKEMRTAGTGGHRSREIQLMWDPQNNFKAKEIEITAVLCDEPGMHSGKHAHMEAVLYVIQGEGYSIIEGEKIPWKKGTCFHVQGPQTIHEHFNTGKIEAQHLRIHFGLRASYFQPIAKRVFPYLYYEYSSYT